LPAGRGEHLGERAEGAGVIAPGGQRQRPQRLNLDDAAGPALASRGGKQPLQQRECGAGVVLGEQHPGQHQIPGLPRVIWLVVWAKTQRQALEAAGIAPSAIELADTDLAAIRWADQPDIDWIFLIPSLVAARAQTVIRPVAPRQLVPFTLQWKPRRAHTMAVARFVHCALAADLPPGWHTQPDHLHHTESDEDPDDPSRASNTIRLRSLTAMASTPSWSGREFWLTARCCG
jgi:hypothetical protein